jgi:hypothetical protein
MGHEQVEHDVIASLPQAGASFALVFGSRARQDHRLQSDYDVGAWWPVDPPDAWEVRVRPGLIWLSSTPHPSNS